MNLDDLAHLFVEGDADEHAITHLLMQHRMFAHAAHGRKLDSALLDKVGIVIEYPTAERSGSGGKELLLSGIRSRISRRSSSPIGFVIDADDPQFTDWSLQQTWDAVRNHLAAAPARIVTPVVPPADGFIGFHSETGIAVGIWLMPDNRRDGAIEHFLDDLRGVSPLVDHAAASTRMAIDQFEAPFPEKDFKKAELATWLAWQSPPGQSYGLALKSKSFHHDSPLAERFVAWVRRLLENQSVLSQPV